MLKFRKKALRLKMYLQTLSAMRDKERLDVGDELNSLEARAEIEGG